MRIKRLKNATTAAQGSLCSVGGNRHTKHTSTGTRPVDVLLVCPLSTPVLRALHKLTAANAAARRQRKAVPHVTGSRRRCCSTCLFKRQELEVGKGGQPLGKAALLGHSGQQAGRHRVADGQALMAFSRALTEAMVNAGSKAFSKQ